MMQRYLDSRATRMRLSKLVYSLLSIFSMGVLLTSSAYSEIQVSASIEPSEISVGEVAQLNVTVSGVNSADIDIPEISGLEFYSSGQSSQVQIVNGSMSSKISYLYRVYAKEAGDYNIGPIKVVAGREQAYSQKLALKVFRSKSSANYFSGGQSGQRQGANPSANDDIASDNNGNESVFVKITPLKNKELLGEKTPVEISLYLQSGVRVSSVSPPEIKGDGFTLHNLSSQPEQSNEVYKGKSWVVVKWYTAVSSVRAGEFDLQFDINAVFQIPERRQRRLPSTGHSFFDRGFFDEDIFNDFFTRYSEKEIRLSTEPQHIIVESFPEQGKPKSFNGAVGRFKVSASASPTNVKAGEPITLKVVVEGFGNFDRVSAPSFTDTANFKSYQADSRFETIDSVGFQGKKTFEQAIIPKGGTKEIPSLEFSYFDTSKQAYVTLKTNAIPISVSGEINKSEEESEKEPQDKTRLEHIVQESKDVLLPIHIELGSLQRQLVPIYKEQWFRLMLVFLSGLLVFGVILSRRDAIRMGNPEILKQAERKQKEIENLSQMKQALGQENAEMFLSSVKSLIQGSLGYVWNVQPDSITLAELRKKLPEGYDSFRQALEAFDAHQYSGVKPSLDELKNIYEKVVNDIRELDKKTIKG